VFENRATRKTWATEAVTQEGTSDFHTAWSDTRDAHGVVARKPILNQPLREEKMIIESKIKTDGT
jgi:hypothetical protein